MINNSNIHSIFQLFRKEIYLFSVKTAIITFAFILSIQLLTPELPKIPENERNKLILLSFIQNPTVLAKLSDIELNKGNFDNASLYIEASIGLLEMNGASEKIIFKYQKKLDAINSK